MGGHAVGLVLRVDGSVGLGRVPLRALGIRAPARMVLGPWVRLGASLGLVAPLPRVRVLVTVRAGWIRLRAAVAWMGGAARRALHAFDRPIPGPADARRADSPRR